MQHLQKTVGGRVLFPPHFSSFQPSTFNRRSRLGRDFRPLPFIPFLFFTLQTHRHNGLPTTPLESIRSALFPSRRGVYPPLIEEQNETPIFGKQWREG